MKENELHKLNRKIKGLEVANSNLKAKIKELEKKVAIDPLTGLIVNREIIKKIYEREVRRSIRSGKSFFALFFDLDFFKRVNDLMGHITGDMVLKKIGSLVSCSVREIDVVCRYGGEEFLVFFPQTEKPEAIIVSRRIKKKIAEEIFTCHDHNRPFSCTISGGLINFKGELTFEDFVNKVDRLLYMAKENGRNCILG